MAFDSGYESLSGFGYTCKKLTGHAPSESRQVILIHRFTTPLGPMFVCATERGVCLLEFVDRRMLETEFSDLQRLLKARIMAGENQHTRQMETEMGEYFTGTRQQFDIALDMPGSEFQRTVWEALQTVPFGKTSHYQALAKQIDKPAAVRAVAGANGANRVAIVIPCHRIIGKDGSLTGYGGGIARKAWLIAHEKKAPLSGIYLFLLIDSFSVFRPPRRYRYSRENVYQKERSRETEIRCITAGGPAARGL